ncbi:MAG: FHA domain-containing protein, partial [Patescibacteria group bacterium]
MKLFRSDIDKPVGEALNLEALRLIASHTESTEPFQLDDIVGIPVDQVMTEQGQDITVDDKNVVAIVEAGRQLFAITVSKPEEDYDDKMSVYKVGGDSLLLDDADDPGSIMIGRANKKFGDILSEYVSGQHFSVNIISGFVEIRDLGSTNGTRIWDNGRTKPRPQARQYVTKSAVERVQDNPEYQPSGENDSLPNGTFGGFQIIGHESKTVKGGVYIGEGAREAILVNDKSPVLQEAVGELMRNITNSETHRTTEGTLLQTMKYVRGKFSNNNSDQELNALLTPLGRDQIVPLSTFVEKGVGVCRHQALTSMLMIESLI